MALYKSMTDSRGMTTSYHKVTHIALNTNFSPAGEVLRMTVGVSSYANQDYRAKDLHNYLQVNHYDFDISMEEATSNSIFAIAYDKLKTLSRFEDSIDI